MQCYKSQFIHLVKKNTSVTVSIFLEHRYFRKHPESQQRFSAFKDVPVEELKGSSKLQAHANSVMYAVTAVVDNLDDSECLVEMLRKLGLNHAGHMVTKQEFKVNNEQFYLSGRVRNRLHIKNTTRVF